MKNNPYLNNEKKEIKEYKLLCKNSPKREYKNYLDWKEHIIKKIKGYDIRTLENLRHFCLYQEKTENRGKEIFLTLSIALISIYLTPFAIPDENLLAAVIGYTLAAIVVALSVVFNYFSYAIPKDFYHDVAEIVQEYIDSFPEDERMLLIAKEENDDHTT